MTRGFDVAVVGAGIVGLGAAYAAARRGLRVVVIDRTGAQVGSSIRNFGHLCIGAQVGQARTFADASRDIWLSLAQDAGFWVRESGTLVAARHADELALLDAAAAEGGIEMLDERELRRRAPIRDGVAVGGGWIAPDLQVNPREAPKAILAHLASLGVEFRLRTAVTGVRPGRVDTTRGRIEAGTVVVAVNHDIDQLLPDLAEDAGVVRCTLDMLRVSAPLARPLAAPLLTGWSLVRYGRFASLPEARAVRDRLHLERPDLASLDLNQMYTQLPDGSLLVGDTHQRDIAPLPFQEEHAGEALLAEASALLDSGPLRVTERWQGVYASAPNDFLIAQPEPGVHVLAATTGIGMTTGLGLAELTLSPEFGRAPELSPEGRS